jgi:hypothetical protein
MPSQEEKDKTKKLLFKRFDDGPSATEGKSAFESAKNEGGGCRPSSYEPLPEEPMDKTVKYAIGAFAFVLAILLVASWSNSNKFYFKSNEQMVELWKGRFAPMGEVRVSTFSDSKILEGVPERDSYSKEEAFGVLFDYLLEEADQILATEKTPDFKAVKSYLAHASKYAVSESAMQAIRMRLNSIDFLVLSGKVDLALSKGTLSDFKAASKYLGEALSLAPTRVQEDITKKRLAAVKHAISAGENGKGEGQLIDIYRKSLDQLLKGREDKEGH